MIMPEQHIQPGGQHSLIRQDRAGQFVKRLGHRYQSLFRRFVRNWVLEVKMQLRVAELTLIDVLTNSIIASMRLLSACEL